MIMSYVIDLADITENDRELVGGKAYNLAKLIHLGINVPEGFTVTTEAYEDTVGQNPAIHDSIDKLRSDRYTLRSLVDFSENLYEQFQQADMRSDVRDAITTAYNNLGGKVAIRSSGSAEDLEKFAFAGQHDSYLNIEGADAVIAKTAACQGSLYTPRAIRYRSENGFGQHVSMGVVVQHQINATAAGTLFTKDVDSGDDVVIIDANYGLGESVVSGKVTPDEFIVDPITGDITERYIDAKAKMCVFADDGTEYVPVPADKQDKQCITDEQVKELTRIAKLIKEDYGQDMDIEWAIEGDTIYITQARALTVKDEDRDFVVHEVPTDANVLYDLDRSHRVWGGLAHGEVRIVEKPSDVPDDLENYVLVARETTPDMTSLIYNEDSSGERMLRAVAMITEEGGKTCHAAITARENGIPTLVGVKDVTRDLKDGMDVYVDASAGAIYTLEEDA